MIQRVQQLRGSYVPEGVHVTVTRNYGETANDKAIKLIEKLMFATALRRSAGDALDGAP